MVVTPDHSQAASLTFPVLPSVTSYLSVEDKEVTVTGNQVVIMYAKPEKTSAVLARLNVGTKLTTDGTVVGQFTRVFRGNTMGWVTTTFLQ
jgi:hypothetical protein